MNPQIVTIANAFYVVAGLIALPSSVATVLYAVFRVRLAMSPAPLPPVSVKNPDAILFILQGMSRALTVTANIFGGISQMVFGIIAAIAGTLLVFAVALYVMGRGLHAHQEWARICGGLLMAALLLVSLVSLLSFRGPLQLMSVSLFAGSLYAISGLWRGFAR